MTMKWRARWTSIGYLLGVVAIVVAWGEQLEQRTLAPRPLALVAALVLALLATMFLAFRCPHCHARQVRGRWDWWLIGDRCTTCWQLLDGPALPEEELSEEMIRETNPALATELRRDRLAFETLLERAPNDPVAARQLEAELSRRVASMTQALVDIQRMRPTDSRTLQDFSRSLSQAQAKLAWCRSLSPGPHHGPTQAA
jgi:hypothetical protein